jgi:hypothetical protein
VSVEAIAACLHHSKASGTDKLVLIGIANHEGDGGAWPSVATLARYANCTERNVQRSLSSLVQLGEIEVVRQAGGNEGTRTDRRPNLYRVLVRCPQLCDGSTKHKTRGDATVTPQPNGVTSTVPRGDAGVINGVTPTSPEPSLEPSGKPLASATQKRNRDLLFEAVAQASGCTIDRLTRTERGQINKATGELREIGATPDQVAAKARAWVRQYPGATLTPIALVKHWSALEGKANRARPSAWDSYEPIQEPF